MSISSIGKSSSDNYELISSVTPTAASAAVNFTGLSVYRKLILVYSGVTLGSAGNNSLRLNNDSGSKYTYFTDSTGGTTIANGLVTSFVLSGSSASTRSGYFRIGSCDNTGVKVIEDGYDYVNAQGNMAGVYLASAIISEINFLTSTTFAGAGTVSLYGAK